MNTAEKFRSPYVPSLSAEVPHQTRPAVTSAWTKLSKAIRDLLGFTRNTIAPAKNIAPARHDVLPIVGKVATISAAGRPPVVTKQRAHAVSRPLVLARAVMPANDRRPGLQNRWKSSDRVAIL